MPNGFPYQATVKVSMARHPMVSAKYTVAPETTTVDVDCTADFAGRRAASILLLMAAQAVEADEANKQCIESILLEMGISEPQIEMSERYKKPVAHRR